MDKFVELAYKYENLRIINLIENSPKIIRKLIENCDNITVNNLIHLTTENYEPLLIKSIETNDIYMIKFIKYINEDLYFNYSRDIIKIGGKNDNIKMIKLFINSNIKTIIKYVIKYKSQQIFNYLIRKYKNNDIIKGIIIKYCIIFNNIKFYEDSKANNFICENILNYDLINKNKTKLLKQSINYLDGYFFDIFDHLNYNFDIQLIITLAINSNNEYIFKKLMFKFDFENDKNLMIITIIQNKRLNLLKLVYEHLPKTAEYKSYHLWGCAVYGNVEILDYLLTHKNYKPRYDEVSTAFNLLYL